MSSSDLVLSTDSSQQPTVLPFDEVDGEEEEEGDDVAMFELVKFGLPTLGIWLLQPLLSLIDSSVVGTSKTATIAEFAALGPGIAWIDSSSYLFQFIGIAVTTLYADALSKNDYKESNRVLTAAKSISFILAVLCFIMQWSFARFFINILTGPNKSIVPYAMIYSRIRSLGALAAVPTIAIQAAFLASKDSVTPLIAVIIGAVVNIVGDLILVNKYGMGIAGAAWATMLAQFITAIYLFKNEKSLRQSKTTNVALRLPKDPPRPTDIIRIGKEVKDDTVNIQVSYGTPEEMANSRRGLPLTASEDTLENTGDRGFQLPSSTDGDLSDGSDTYQYDDGHDIYSSYLSVVDDSSEVDNIMDVLEDNDEPIEVTDNITGATLIDIYDGNEGNEVDLDMIPTSAVLEQETQEEGEVFIVSDNDVFTDLDMVVTDLTILDQHDDSNGIIEVSTVSNTSGGVNEYEADPSMEIEVLVPKTEAVITAAVDTNDETIGESNDSSLSTTFTTSVESVVESVADLIQSRKLLTDSKWSPGNSMRKSERVYSAENYTGPDMRDILEQKEKEGMVEVPKNSRMMETGRPRSEEEISPEEAQEIESKEELALRAQSVVPPPLDISKSWKLTTAMTKSQENVVQEATAQATTMMATMVSDMPEPEAFFKWPDKNDFDEFFGFCGPLFLILLLKTVLWNSTTVAVAPNGPVAMASHQILLNFFMYFVIFGDVLSQCSQTYLPALFRRTRKNILRSFESARKLMLTNLKLGMIVGSVNSVMAWLLAAYGTTFFTPSKEVQNLVRSAAMGFALCVLPHASLAGFEGVILSTRDVGYQGFVYIISSLFFILYQNHVKVNRLGLAAVWNGFYLYQFFRVLLFGFRVKYLTNKRVRDGRAALERGEVEPDLSL
jgi:Na+-driven multidrug efflux pump